MFTKNLAKAYVIAETIVKGPAVRHLAVNFMGGLAAGALCDSLEEENEVNVPRRTAVLIATLVINHAINQVFDTVLEKKDEEVYDEFEKKMREIDEML